MLDFIKSPLFSQVAGPLYKKYGQPALKQLAQDDTPDLDWNDHAYNIVDSALSKVLGVSPDPLVA